MWVVEVVKVSDGVDIGRLRRFGPFDGAFTIGRADGNDVVLPDLSISAEHLRIENGQLLAVGSGATYVNQVKLPSGNAIDLEEVHFIQLGGVLLKLSSHDATRSFDVVMSFNDERVPLFDIRIVGQRVEVKMGGNALSLYPSAARVFALLCKSPNKIATHSEIDEAADPENFPRQGGSTVPQLITFVRTGIIESVTEHGPYDQLKIEGDLRPFVRELIENVRGVGYRLNLDDSLIVVTEY